MLAVLPGSTKPPAVTADDVVPPPEVPQRPEFKSPDSVQLEPSYTSVSSLAGEVPPHTKARVEVPSPPSASLAVLIS